MPSDPMIKMPAVEQQPRVAPYVASVLQSLRNVVVARMWSNWVLYEVLEQEIQRQRSLFPRPPSTPTTKLNDSYNVTPATSSSSAPCPAETEPRGKCDTFSQVRATTVVDGPSTYLCRRSIPFYTNCQDQRLGPQAKNYTAIPLVNVNHAKKVPKSGAMLRHFL